MSESSFGRKFDELNSFMTGTFGSGKGWIWKEEFLESYDGNMRKFKATLRKQPDIIIEELKKAYEDLIKMLKEELNRPQVLSPLSHDWTVDDYIRETQDFITDLTTLLDLLEWFKRYKQWNGDRK